MGRSLEGPYHVARFSSVVEHYHIRAMGVVENISELQHGGNFAPHDLLLYSLEPDIEEFLSRG